MKLNQYGATNGVTLGLIACIVLLVASLVFGFWAFSGKQKYQNNADKLISAAVTTAKEQQQTTDNKAYAIEAENPLTKYVGPQAYGTISLLYPKNWSGYVNTQTGGSGTPVDGYFYPGVLPQDADSSTFNFALRIQVTGEAYSQLLTQFQGEQQDGQANVTAYSLPKVPSVVGVKVVGNLGNDTTGTMIILPLRSEALEVWTEGNAFLTQYNNYILPNLSFTP